MKKILFTLMLLFSLSVNVIANEVPVTKRVENVQKIELDRQAAKYDFTVNYEKIGCCLDMSLEQLDDFKFYFDKFKDNMMFAYYGCNETSRCNFIKNAVDKNVKEMSYILNEKQHKKYLTLLNMTLKNRGFNI